MNVNIHEDYQSMSKAAANLVARRIISRPDLVLGLPTGDTPKGFYRELIDFYEAGLLDFSKVTTFNLDEYYPLSRDNPISFTNYMYERFFNHVNVSQNKIHIPDGETDRVADECQDYEEMIAEEGGLDLTVLGIGENGHIGYNEPGSKLGSKTRLVELSEESIVREVPGNYDGIINKALTMGVKTIMNSRKLALLASGPRKANVIHDALEGPVTGDVPASILQLHPEVTVILDREAAGDLDGGELMV